MLTLNQVHNGHCLDLLGHLPDNYIHSCITSPPYWGLRDYGIPPVHWPEVSFVPIAGLPPVVVPEQTCCLGLESDIWAYVGHMILIFREVKRVLREDGTLWMNLGDTYAGSWGAMSYPGGSIAVRRFGGDNQENVGRPVSSRLSVGLKAKDLASIPWRVALALQADGWYLRSDIIWHKPNPMPESVTDRPTKAHEYVFLLSKSERYFYDQEAIREELSESTLERWGKESKRFDGHNDYFVARDGGKKHINQLGDTGLPPSGKRNKRTVWTVATQSYSAAHFATFPEKLIEPMILASTSDYGVCGKCDNPWVRVVEKVTGDNPSYNGSSFQKGKTREARENLSPVGEGERTAVIITTGWQPSCACNAPTVPAIVLDPFMGSGTTGKVAIANRRDFIGFEMNPMYAAELAKDRIDGTQIKMMAEWAIAHQDEIESGKIKF